LSQLARWLSLKDAEVAAWAKTAGWEIDGDVAVVPKNGDNDVKAGVVGRTWS
jgi:translation initiation factor 3 subunit K